MEPTLHATAPRPRNAVQRFWKEMIALYLFLDRIAEAIFSI